MQQPNFPKKYVVKGSPMCGGMGAVWRVYYADWGCDLAAKQPLETRRSDKSIKLFREECSIANRLPMHPNVVSTYYVLEIDGVPTAFSEWMDGGSLAERIKDKSLYTGTPAEQLTRILDIAIQTARGLNHAHQHDIIHCDVKPENVLFSGDTAKIADFGIASGLLFHESQGTQLGDFRGLSREYASPEQMEKTTKALTRRTDIYSWAVMILVLLRADCCWQYGDVVSSAYARYLKDACVPVPSALDELLRQCVKRDESNRPHDFDVVIQRLEAIYRALNPGGYTRNTPDEDALSLASLNAEALCHIDTGDPNKARSCWIRVLRADPLDMCATFNRSLSLWREGFISDLDAVVAVRDVYAVRKNSMNAFALACMLSQTMDIEGAVKYAKIAAEDGNDDAKKLIDRLEPALARRQRNQKAFARLDGRDADRLAINARGDSLYIATKESLVYIDLNHCKEEVSLPLDKLHGSVTALCVTPNSEALAIGYADGTVELRNARSLALVLDGIASLGFRGVAVSGLEFSADRTRLVVGLHVEKQSRQFTVGMVRNGRDLSMEGGTTTRNVGTTILMHPTEPWILADGKNGLEICTYSTLNVKTLYTLEEHASQYAFSDDGRSVFYLGRKGLSRWDYGVGKIKTICDFPAAYLLLRKGEDKALLIAGDGTTHTIDLTNGRCLSTCTLNTRPATNGVLDAAYCGRYSCVFTITAQGKLATTLCPSGGVATSWHRAQATDESTETLRRTVFLGTFARAESRADAGDYTGALADIAAADAIPIRVNAKQYDAFVRRVHQCCRVVGLTCVIPERPLSRRHPVQDACVAVSPDGVLLADYCEEDDSLTIYDLNKREPILYLNVARFVIGSARDFAVSDGAYAAFVCPKRQIMVCALAAKKEVACVSLKSDCAALAFSYDETRLAIAEQNGTIRILDIKLNRETSFRVRGEKFERLAFDPDGRYLLVYTQDGSRILQYDAQTLREIRVYIPGSYNLRWHGHVMALSPDGQTFCGYNEEKKRFVIYALDSGEIRCVTPLQYANALCFDTTGMYLYALQSKSLVALIADGAQSGKVAFVRRVTQRDCALLVAAHDGERLYLDTPGATIESLYIRRAYDYGAPRACDKLAYELYRKRIRARFPNETEEALKTRIDDEMKLRGCYYVNTPAVHGNS